MAFFYGGMTRATSVLNMMMMSFSAIAVVAVVRVLWGYSMSSSAGVAQLFGNPFEAFGLADLVAPAISSGQASAPLSLSSRSP